MWVFVLEPEPAVPVTVRVDVPAGVPGLGVTPPPPLPPHAAIVRVSNIPSARATSAVRGRLAPGSHQVRTAQARAVNSKARRTRLPGPGRSGRAGGSGRERGATMEGAVVVTETATAAPVLLALVEGAVQLASEGAPAQAKVTV